ncbi:hypothetical protein NUW58_g9022 [Xylaria curta]|uniref:Uncharacterized protein n=1 Tax=Xylaria curta TaxID=42375 RepID=A0ACC1N1E7_9PEZI|nr:hypothetical protein NUW58_g9022 [Xylaria curta]
MIASSAGRLEEGQHDGNKKKLHFVIVGGSLGGLATGIALKALGHDTTILERNPKPLLQDQGAGIVAGGDTLDFFERYNRCDRPLAVTSYARQYLDRDGNIVHKEEMVQRMTSWDLTYYLMRANYDGVKSSYCEVPDPDPGHGKATHIHDRNVTSIKEESSDDGNEGVRVFWNDSQGNEGSILADILIGADGPSSTIRKLVQPNVERKYAGYCALRGTLIESEASEETRKTCCERFTFFHCPAFRS